MNDLTGRNCKTYMHDPAFIACKKNKVPVAGIVHRDHTVAHRSLLPCIAWQTHADDFIHYLGKSRTVIPEG